MDDIHMKRPNRTKFHKSNLNISTLNDWFKVLVFHWDDITHGIQDYKRKKEKENLKIMKWTKWESSQNSFYSRPSPLFICILDFLYLKYLCNLQERNTNWTSFFVLYKRLLIVIVRGGNRLDQVRPQKARAWPMINV